MQFVGRGLQRGAGAATAGAAGLTSGQYPSDVPTLIGNVIGNISGNLSVAGSNTQVIFNDSGLANASAGFTFNKTSNLVTVTGNIAGGNISTTGALTIGTDAVIAGNLTVSGTTEYTNVTTLAIQDPVISIGRGANNTPLVVNDGKDRGEQLYYFSSAERSAFIGFDNSAEKLFAALQVSNDGSDVITVNNYGDRKSTRLNSSHIPLSRMPSSA